jgi:CBS domain-containing protein
VKTSAILHRVADFLKGFPPFCYLDAAGLETIAASGRVRFHERDEILFSAGEAGDGWLRVIQQGTVRLTRPAPAGDHVVDLLGAGDIAGLGQLLGRSTHEHSATTLSDTVIYALDFETVASVCAGSPQATRFLHSHRAAAQAGIDSTSTEAAPRRATAATIARGLVTCSANHTLQAVAASMQRERLEALPVVDGAGRPIGCVTTAGVCAAVAADEAAAQAQVARYMESAPPTVAADASIDTCLLEMLRHDRRQLCVTADGTPDTAATALLTEEDLLLWHGGNPTVIVRALGRSDRLAEIVAIRHLLDPLVQRGLQEFQHLDRYAAIVREANRALLRTLSERAAATTAAALGAPAPGDFCLALVGEAGRDELMAPGALEAILILDRRAAENDPWFAAFAGNIVASLTACGFAAPSSGLSPVNAACRLSLESWGERFRAWIASPIEQDIVERLPFFDFSPVQSSHPLAESLRATVREALRGHPAFIALLANDCFENLPPLTILEGYAVDAEGSQTEELALQEHALRPVADVARVFQLAAGDIAVTSTLERLAHAERSRPDDAPIFEAAARAFRIALSCRATVGLKTGTDGARIRPALLPRTDQLLLKSGFQSIAALLEHAARAHGLR